MNAINRGTLAWTAGLKVDALTLLANATGFRVAGNETYRSRIFAKALDRPVKSEL
jgi:hypothetical protein